MSKAEKMRGRLASIQRDREQFERQKKELENDMNVGRDNMNKIKKGLKNNSIASEAIVIDEKLNNHHYGANASPGPPNHYTENSPLTGANKKTLKRQLTPNGNKWSDASFMPSALTNSPLQSQHAHHQQQQTSHSSANSPRPLNGNGLPVSIMPTGPRISDWCYSAPLESAPPVVKNQELYENVRFLGRGAFGDVSLVKNVEDNKLFAVKQQLVPKDSEYQSVLHEVRFLRANRHPCIIDVHDAFLTVNPRIVHIVMHYCESGNLASFISNARKNKTSFPESHVVRWVLQLALALQFLHQNNAIHRDLKPMNIMLTGGGDLLKLGDFGLAMHIHSDDRKEEVSEAGTPYYTAPEMIQREPYSYPADCWSFGVVLHQILALERPFDGSSTADLVRAILSETLPPLPTHYSEEIRMIARHLLRRKPEERLSMTELLADHFIHTKAASFPQQYRPKAMEERIRRSHMKQLESQMETITALRKTFTPLAEKDKLLNPEGIPKGESGLLNVRADHISRANSDMTDVSNATSAAYKRNNSGIKGIAVTPLDGIDQSSDSTATTTNPNTSNGTLSISGINGSNDIKATTAVTSPLLTSRSVTTPPVPRDMEKQDTAADDSVVNTTATAAATDGAGVAAISRELALTDEDEGPDPVMESALHELLRQSSESADSEAGGKYIATNANAAASADSYESQQSQESRELEKQEQTQEQGQPLGGRIGQELARAKEVDHYFEMHQEEVHKAMVAANAAATANDGDAAAVAASNDSIGSKVETAAIVAETATSAVADVLT